MAVIRSWCRSTRSRTARSGSRSSGGWVSIPSYEIRRIVPDESEEALRILAPLPAPPADADVAILAPPAQPADSGVPLYVATRSGATVRARRWRRPRPRCSRHQAQGLAHVRAGRRGRGVARADAARPAAEGLDQPVGRRGRSQRSDEPASSREGLAAVPASSRAGAAVEGIPACDVSDRPHRLELAERSGDRPGRGLLAARPAKSASGGSPSVVGFALVEIT